MRKIYFLSFLISFASQNANAQKTENYLPNANFETWVDANSLTSWSLVNTAVSSTITQETTNVISGSTNSIKYEPTVDNEGILSNASVITIDTNGKYYFGIWIKTDSGAKIKTGVKRVRSGEANFFGSSTYTAPDAEWHYVVYSSDFLVGDQVTIRISPRSGGLNTIFYLDDASFNEDICSGNMEWDFMNSTARTYSTFWNTNNYGGSDNGTLSEENTNANYVKSGYKSLKYVTNSDASNNKRGVIISKNALNLGIRYIHPANTTRKYQFSAWIKTPTGSDPTDIVMIIKYGSESDNEAYTIQADTWTQIFSDVVELDNTDDGDQVYPSIQFKTPSVTHYIDDIYLNWDGIKWQGGTSTDWDTASNWSSNMVPNSKSVVTIPSGLSNYPTAASAVTVSSVDMAAGTSLISTSTFSGTVKYTRTLADTADDWYLITSPVNAQDIDTFITREGLASSGTNIGLSNTYATYSDTWNYYQSTGSNFGNFNPGKGYAIKLANPGDDIYFEGAIRNVDVTRALSTSANGYNLVGNVYTSYMDTAAMLAANTGVLGTETIWVWNSSTGSYDTKVTADAYKLAPAQGFFVKSDGQTGDLALNQAYEVHNASDTFQRTEPRPEIHLTLSDGPLSRLAKIYYINGTTTGFDNGYDGEMFGGTSNEFAIYSHLVSNESEIDLAVQSLPTNNYENMVIPVGINAESGTITIDVSTNNFPEGVNIYLEDKEDDSFTLLDSTSVFTTTPDEDLNGIGRFYIHTTTTALSDNQVSLTNVSMYVVDSNLTITGVHTANASIRVYDLVGKEVVNTSFEGTGLNKIELPILTTGVYVVQLETQTEAVNKKIIIKK